MRAAAKAGRRRVTIFRTIFCSIVVIGLLVFTTTTVSLVRLMRNKQGMRTAMRSGVQEAKQELADVKTGQSKLGTIVAPDRTQAEPLGEGMSPPQRGSTGKGAEEVVSDLPSSSQVMEEEDGNSGGAEIVAQVIAPHSLDAWYGVGNSISECPPVEKSVDCANFMSPFAHAAAQRARWGRGKAGRGGVVDGIAHFGRTELVRSFERAVGDECEYLWGLERSTKQSLWFRTRGQMSNVFIQYFYMRIVADANHLPLHERKNVTRLKKINMKFNASEARATRSLRHFRYVDLHEVGDKKEVVVDARCGQWFQNYNYFSKERCFAQCLFATGNDSISETLLGMSCNDVVIHLRIPWFRDGVLRNHTVPSYSFYDAILSKLKAEGRLGQVWIVSDSRICVSDLAKQIKKGFGAKCHGGSVAQDHFLARSAPVFIGSFGTFTWTVALLASSREIHLPFDSSHPEGSSWCPWHSLFIDDDPRVVYHDLYSRHMFMTADEVKQSKTVFAQGIVRGDSEKHSICFPRTVKVSDEIG